MVRKIEHCGLKKQSLFDTKVRYVKKLAINDIYYYYELKNAEIYYAT